MVDATGLLPAVTVVTPLLAAVMILVVSVLRDDWMIGMVGVIILCVGNAGLMLLAYILNRIDSP